MKVAWFDAEQWEKEYLETKNIDAEVDFIEKPLNEETVGEAAGYDAVAVFVSSRLGEDVLEQLDAQLICCRSTGFDHVDLDAAEEEGITVCNVPEYGGTTVAEHTFGLILALSRKIYEAINRVEEGKFDHNGLRGFDLKGKKLGVIGTGAIGKNVIRIANGFDMNVVAFDPEKDEEAARRMGYMYVSLEDLLQDSDIVTLHCPLNEHTEHLISDEQFSMMEDTMLVNTARGGLVDTEALLEALDDGSVRAAGLDVLEEECRVEEDIEVIEHEDECDLKAVLEGHLLKERDDVLITPHNAFNSEEAMHRIADTTVENIENKSNPVF